MTGVPFYTLMPQPGLRDTGGKPGISSQHTRPTSGSDGGQLHVALVGPQQTGEACQQVPQGRLLPKILRHQEHTDSRSYSVLLQPEPCPVHAARQSPRSAPCLPTVRLHRRGRAAGAVRGAARGSTSGPGVGRSQKEPSDCLIFSAERKITP